MSKYRLPRFKTQCRGFTLIELLVVVVIISISISFVVVNLSPGGDAELAEEEVLRLQQILRFAHEQSVVRAEEYGVRFYETGYRFMIYNEVKELWVDLDKDKLLRARSLPQPLELDLYIEQIPVEILPSRDDDPEIKDKKSKLATAASNIQSQNSPELKKIKPHIYLLSSSELMPPFELRIRIPGSDIEEHLEGLPQGIYRRMLSDE